jgi:hypothetical protein
MMAPSDSGPSATQTNRYREATMSKSPTNSPSPHELEEQEVRDALLGGAAGRDTTWMFEQGGDAGL